MYTTFHKKVDNDVNFSYRATIRDSDVSKMFTHVVTEATKKHLERKPEILPSFLAPFTVRCRRITRGQTTSRPWPRPNFITSEIDHINETGLALKNGRRVNLDVLVCATGFHTNAIPLFPITGRNGLTLKDKFIPFAESYLSITVDELPNMCLMLGPNAGLGAGSLTILIETLGDHAVKCVRKLQRENYATMEPKVERVRDIYDYADECS